MIDTKTGIALPAVSLVIPERTRGRIRIRRADSIDPALIHKASKQSSRLWLYQRVLRAGLGDIDIGVSRHHVEIASEYSGGIEGVKLGRMG
jgi:hypothetical protein